MSGGVAADLHQEPGQARHESTSPAAGATSGAAPAMLPKALTVSPTDLFPEEQFESSDSEDDAELHAFTQRLDADWRSNLSQALSWNPNSALQLKPAPCRGSKSSGQASTALDVNSCKPEGVSALTEKAVDGLCQQLEEKTGLTTVSAPGPREEKHEEERPESGMSRLAFCTRHHFWTCQTSFDLVDTDISPSEKT